MEKLGKILLLLLNVLIDTFLIFVVLVLLLWLIWDVSPQQSVQNSLIWIQTTWDNLWGITSPERTNQLSSKFQKRAHRQIYVVEPNKRDEQSEDLITQPYK